MLLGDAEPLAGRTTRLLAQVTRPTLGIGPGVSRPPARLEGPTA